ncbi:uncharacterized protein ACR2FA_011971 [Aphomia sociella]
MKRKLNRNVMFVALRQLSRPTKISDTRRFTNPSPASKGDLGYSLEDPNVVFVRKHYKRKIVPCFIIRVTTTMVASIRVSSNGNSPEIKMLGGMMVDVKKGLAPVTPKSREKVLITNYDKSRRLNNNSTKLSINERYRRLIPYMTFYYANDLVLPTTEAYNTKDVEVQKAEIIEATTIGVPNERQPKKIVFSSHRNIPRYQGNRLTQYNIASANPTKNFYKDPTNQNIVRVIPNNNPLLIRHPIISGNDHNYESFEQKQIIKVPSVPFTTPNRSPYVNPYNNGETPNIRYYLDEKEQSPKFKLVPYEQTPPVTVIPQIDNYYNAFKKPVPVLGIRNQVYIKPKPIRPQYYYDNSNIQQTTARKQPAPAIFENYYDKRPTHPALVQPIIETGFKPIASPALISTEVPIYTSMSTETSLPYYGSEIRPTTQPPLITSTVRPDTAHPKSNYLEYSVEDVKLSSEQATFKPILEQPIYKDGPYASSNTVTLGDLINSLQLNKSIPKPITRENVGSSIRTLLQVLNALRAAPIQNDVELSALSTPKPFVTTELAVEMTEKPFIEKSTPILDEGDYHEEEYLPPVKTPSQHIDDYQIGGGTSQQFPLPVTSDDEGGTPGQPGVDYPILTTIPHTRFDCKTQRYKGFFADPETRCQVWHYCDLNGGQASFLCPNGTIFSQAALTCDWWFNVKCSSAAQLYVLNESLYKFILPHSPKFPEDYSGPLVDKYLTLKFKEMEEQFKKNKKNKQTASEKMDNGDSTDSSDESNKKEEDSVETSEYAGSSKSDDIIAPSVIVESPGMSGNVERLTD